MTNESAWRLFKLDDLLGDVKHGSLSLKEFLRTPSLSCAVYHVPAGSNEMSKAHEEDELYLILEGKGLLRIGDEIQEVSPGTLMYVQAACDHTYFDISESITALVFFGAPIRQMRR